MSRIRETKFTFYLSEEQKADLYDRARKAGLTVPNYLRSLLGWPPEKQGERKDIRENSTKSPPSVM